MWPSAVGVVRGLADGAGRLVGDLLGEGLPAPCVALERAAFRMDEPGTWCLRCGSGACVLLARAGAQTPGVESADRRARMGSGANVRTSRRTNTGTGMDASTQTYTHTDSSSRDAGLRIPCAQGVRGRRIVRLGRHAGELREWVIAIKHAAWQAMAEELGRLLGRQLLWCAPDLCGTPCGVVVVPVPSPWLRRLERGADHAASIAHGVARELDVPCVQPLRQRAFGTQVQRSAAKARRNAGRAVGRFSRGLGPAAWLAQRRIRGRVVIVVDDVRTTGATLDLVGAELRRLGAAAVIEAVLSVREWTPGGVEAGDRDSTVWIPCQSQSRTGMPRQGILREHGSAHQ